MSFVWMNLKGPGSSYKVNPELCQPRQRGSFVIVSTPGRKAAEDRGPPSAPSLSAGRTELGLPNLDHAPLNQPLN